MNFRLSNISLTRRLFLGAVVAVVLVVGWVATESLRMGMENHHVGTRTILGWAIIENYELKIGDESINWEPTFAGFGNLYQNWGRIYYWTYARIDCNRLNAVTPDHALGAKYETLPLRSGPPLRGFRPNSLLIGDSEIILVRRSDDTQTVYALQAVEQKDGRGHFRSRRIPFSAGAGGTVSNAVPFAPTNR